MRMMVSGLIAVALIGWAGSRAQAAPEDDIRAVMDKLLEKVVAKDAKGVQALTDARGFIGLDATEASVKLTDAEGFAQWATAQDVPPGSKVTKIDTDVWKGVATAVASMGVEPGDGAEVLAVLCYGAGRWQLNGVAVFDSLSADAEGATVATDIQKAFAKASDEGDPAAAIDYLNEDAFVTVVSDPAGQSNVFTSSEILRQMLDMVASGGEMKAKFTDPAAQGNGQAGFVATNVEISFGTMVMHMRGVFLTAKIDGEWVVPLGALGIVPEKAAQ